MCLNDNILNNDEKNYLLKYTDNVPYTFDDIDHETLYDLQDKYNIVIDENEPLNSGIVSIAFKATYYNTNSGNYGNNVVIKLLKNNIKDKIEKVFDEMNILINIINVVPFIKRLNLKKCLLDNKELLIHQTDFITEANNIEVFRNLNSNHDEFIIPKCYKHITHQYNNIIVMQNIKGLTYDNIKDYDECIKIEFGKLLLKFGFISILYNSAVHCDVHAGNIFFYINNETSNKPKYQLGLIDFGIVTFPSKENQNYYYKFFKNKKIDKENDKLEEVLGCLIEEKNKYINLDSSIKKLFIKEAENLANVFPQDDFTFFIYLSNLINSYGFTFTKEFNQL